MLGELQSLKMAASTYCSCGTMPGSAEAGVMGVMGGPGVAGKIPTPPDAAADAPPLGLDPDCKQKIFERQPLWLKLSYPADPPRPNHF